jgi:hypothetical protein
MKMQQTSTFSITASGNYIIMFESSISRDSTNLSNMILYLTSHVSYLVQYYIW